MHTISVTMRRERSYYTGVVVYWRRREAWVFQRSFRLESACAQWMAAKSKALKAHGPELPQAAE